MPRLARTAKIAERVHFHGLRHTMAFELAGEGLPIHLIQQQLGHSNAAITSRYLVHLNPVETINAMKARSWGQQPIVSQNAKIVSQISGFVSPDWADRLRADIGDRLLHFIDARTNEQAFRAIVLVFRYKDDSPFSVSMICKLLTNWWQDVESRDP